jgi:hypothetical protein
VPDLPELASDAITMRGGSLESERSFGTVQLLMGRNQTSRPTGTWGVGLARSLAPGDRAGANLLVKEEDAGTQGLRRTGLACLSGVRGAGEARAIRLEAALSRSTLGDAVRWGSAAHVRYDENQPRFAARLRGHLGTDRFAGRTRDRDGAAAYILYTPGSPLRLWSSLDAARGRTSLDGAAPTTATRRYRLGGRYARDPWPALELYTSGDRERAESPDSLRDQDRRSLGILLSRSFGPFLGSASGQWGTVRHARSGRAGSTRILDLVGGGAVAAVRGALHYLHSDDWDPELLGRVRSASWTGDIACGVYSGRLEAGLALSSRRVESATDERRVRRDVRFTPRVDLALRPMLRLRADASFAGVDGPLEPDRWQVQLSYSGRESLPLPWRPIRGSIRGLVFVDADGDREPDPSEERMPNVMLRLDGRTLLTDERGVFELPALEPGTYWLEVQSSSLPAGVVPRDPLPLEIQVQPGDDRLVLVTLVESGTISGWVFLDSDHDGTPSTGETGMPELRVDLTRGGTHVADALTDAAGRYRFGDLAPGTYGVTVRESWLPSGWVVTSPQPIAITLDRNGHVAASPCGLAPRSRPIHRTYSGDSR